MRHEVRVLARARRELDLACDWYEGERTGLGREFIEAIEGLFERLAHQPLSFPLVGAVTRRARPSPFSYSVLFVVEGDKVLVTGLLHAHRGPETWKGRVRESHSTAYDTLR